MGEAIGNQVPPPWVPSPWDDFSANIETLYRVDASAGTCGEHAINSVGIGAACNKGGGECEPGTLCSADQSSKGGEIGICIMIGCNFTRACGGVTCCASAEAGGIINICIPEACCAPDCAPKD